MNLRIVHVHDRNISGVQIWLLLIVTLMHAGSEVEAVDSRCDELCQVVYDWMDFVLVACVWETDSDGGDDKDTFQNRHQVL